MLSRTILTVVRGNRSFTYKRFYSCANEVANTRSNAQMDRIYEKYALMELELEKARGIMYKMAKGRALDDAEKEDLDESLRKYRLQRMEDLRENRRRTGRKMEELSGMLESIVNENKKLQTNIEGNASMIRKIEDEVNPLNQKLEKLNGIDLDSNEISNRDLDLIFEDRG